MSASGSAGVALRLNRASRRSSFSKPCSGSSPLMGQQEPDYNRGYGDPRQVLERDRGVMLQRVHHAAAQMALRATQAAMAQNDEKRTNRAVRAARFSIDKEENSRRRDI